MKFKRMLKRIMGVILLVSIISESMLNTYAAYDNNVENDIGEIRGLIITKRIQGTKFSCSMLMGY